METLKPSIIGIGHTNSLCWDVQPKKASILSSSFDSSSLLVDFFCVRLLGGGPGFVGTSGVNFGHDLNGLLNLGTGGVARFGVR